MEVKPGYKQTEVGVIPKDWDVQSIGDFLSVQGGFSFNSADYCQDGVNLLKISNVSFGRVLWEDLSYLPKEFQIKFGKYSLKSGDLIMAMTRPVVAGGIKIAIISTKDLPCLLNQRVCRFITQKNIEIPFFYYLLFTKRFTAYVQELSFASQQPNLSGKDIEKFLIPHPTLPEQHAIATALSNADAQISLLEQVIAKKRNIKQAATQELLTGRIRLPGFIGEWTEKTLENVASIVSGGTPKTTISEYWNGNIAWCTPTDITGTPGKYLEKTEWTISEEGLKNCSASLLPVGSLLLCTRATIGEIKIAGLPICTNQGFKSLICKADISSEFLYYKLLTMKSKLMEKASGSTFLEISKKDVAALFVDFPSLPEQRAIATVLSDMDAELTALEQQRDKTKAIKQGMMQELLTGRIRLV